MLCEVIFPAKLQLPGVCEASDKYVDQLDDVLKHCCPKKVAAFFCEAIQVWTILNPNASRRTVRDHYDAWSELKVYRAGIYLTPLLAKSAPIFYANNTLLLYM